MSMSDPFSTNAAPTARDRWLTQHHSVSGRAEGARRTSAVDERRRSVPTRDGHHGNARVLLAEGRGALRSMMRRSLTAEHDVLAVASVHDAYDALASFQPDILVWNVVLPELTGTPPTASLEQLPAGGGLPVLLVSRNIDATMRHWLALRGAPEFLVEPFAADELCARVGNVLARHATVAQLRSQVRSAQERVEQLQGALSSRVIIEQAKGVLAGELGMSVDVAFEHLRAYARSHNHRVHDVAHAVVCGGFRF